MVEFAELAKFSRWKDERFCLMQDRGKSWYEQIASTNETQYTIEQLIELYFKEDKKPKNEKCPHLDIRRGDHPSRTDYCAICGEDL